MKHPRIFKFEATGNDFILVDLRHNPFPAKLKRAEWVRQICDRHFSVGADGALFLENENGFDFKWDFYNADGSNAEMCGNASRCVALFEYQQNKKTKLKFKTRAGEIETTFTNPDKIDVTMPAIKQAKWNQSAPVEDQAILYDFVNSGVPHAVIKIPNFKDKSFLRAWARTLKALPIFGIASTNVTFVKVVGTHAIKSMTFERGVENFTLSCGTGAVAAAYTLLRDEENIPVTVEVPGGQLTVVLKNGRPHLLGPAKLIGEILLKDQV